MLRFSLLFAFFLSIALPISQALYINFEGKKEYCFYVTVNEGVNLTISYVVSGYNEHLVTLKVFSPTNLPLKTVEMQKEQFFDIYIAESGKQKICFMNMDGTSKILAFDFMETEKRKEAEIATKENLESVIKELKKNFKNLQVVHKYQQFQQVRDEVHAETISQTESRVKWCSIFKIFVLILICISQIYVLTGFFKGKKGVVV